MTDSTTIARLVARLTPGQREALLLLPTWGLPAGHNSWPAAEYVLNDGSERRICDGTDMDALLRSDLAKVVTYKPGEGVLGEESDASWRLDATPLGLAARALLSETGDKQP